MSEVKEKNERVLTKSYRLRWKKLEERFGDWLMVRVAKELKREVRVSY